jgi:hypothetical protein
MTKRLLDDIYSRIPPEPVVFVEPPQLRYLFTKEKETKEFLGMAGATLIYDCLYLVPTEEADDQYQPPILVSKQLVADEAAEKYVYRFIHEREVVL